MNFNTRGVALPALLLTILTLASLSIAYSATLSIKSYEIQIGDTVNVSIIIEDAQDIAGAVIKVVYDSDVVSVEKVEAGDLGAPEYMIRRGEVSLAIASAEPCRKYECIVSYIVVKGVGEGCTDLRITSAELSDYAGRVIAPEISHGKVCVKSTQSTPSSSPITLTMTKTFTVTTNTTAIQPTAITITIEKLVTVTSRETVAYTTSQIFTTSYTTTKVVTTTIPITETNTKTVISTVTTTVTAPIVATTTITIPVAYTTTQMALTTITGVLTTSVTVIDWSTAGAVAAVLLILGFALGYMIKRK